MNTTTMILPALGLGLFASLAWGMTQERVECAQAAQTVRSAAAPSAQSAEPSTSVAARSLVRFLGQQDVSTKVTTGSIECQKPSATASQPATVVLYPEDPVLLVQDERVEPILVEPREVATIRWMDTQEAVGELERARAVAAMAEAQAQDRAASRDAAERDLALIQEQMAGLRPSHSRYRSLQADFQDLAQQLNRASAQSRAEDYLRQADASGQREDERTRRLEARIEALERRLAERDARQARAEAPRSRSRSGLFAQPEAEEVEPPEEPYFTQRPAPAPPQAPQVFWRRAPDAPDAPDADFLPAPRLPSRSLALPPSRAPRAESAPAPNRVQLWTSPALPPGTNQSVDLGELSELLREMREQVSDLRQDLRSLRNDLRQLSASGLR